MFIETEGTPNPATLKFLPGREVLGGRGTADFTAAAEAEGRSALAARIFGVGEVARVFLGNDFITVTKTEAADWQMLRARVLGAIMEHYLSGLPALEGAEEEEEAEDFAEEDGEIVAQIKELLDTRVRPAVAGDGGDIVFRGFREGVVLPRHAQARRGDDAAALRAGGAAGGAGRGLIHSISVVNGGHPERRLAGAGRWPHLPATETRRRPRDARRPDDA
jgi:hypothetical protein